MPHMVAKPSPQSLISRAQKADFRATDVIEAPNCSRINRVGTLGRGSTQPRPEGQHTMADASPEPSDPPAHQTGWPSPPAAPTDPPTQPRQPMHPAPTPYPSQPDRPGPAPIPAPPGFFVSPPETAPES